MSGTTYRGGGSYSTSNSGSAGNVFVGCYQEGSQPFAQFVTPTTIIDGSIHPNVKGVPYFRGTSSTIQIYNGGISATGNSSLFGATNGIGPQSGAAADSVLNLNNTNVSSQIIAVSSSNGTLGSLDIRFGVGIRYNVNNAGWSHFFRINGTDTFSVGASGAGYVAGVGGAVTQITSRTTGVTLNKVCGQITLFSAAGTATWQTFTVTNSNVAATDVIRISQASGTDKYMLHVTHVAAGSFDITYATTGGTTTEQPVFNFSILKAVNA